MPEGELANRVRKGFYEGKPNYEAMLDLFGHLSEGVTIGGDIREHFLKRV